MTAPDRPDPAINAVVPPLPSELAHQLVAKVVGVQDDDLCLWFVAALRHDEQGFVAGHGFYVVASDIDATAMLEHMADRAGAAFRVVGAPHIPDYPPDDLSNGVE